MYSVNAELINKQNTFYIAHLISRVIISHFQNLLHISLLVLSFAVSLDKYAVKCCILERRKHFTNELTFM